MQEIRNLYRQHLIQLDIENVDDLKNEYIYVLARCWQKWSSVSKMQSTFYKYMYVLLMFLCIIAKMGKKKR